jgi:hypothetical protein
MTSVSAPSVRLGSREIYYGWIIVAVLSVTETITWGIVYYGFPVFLRPMEQDLGAPAWRSPPPSRSASAWRRWRACRSVAGSIVAADGG